MKKALLICIALMLMLSASAAADPLTDYRLGHFQIGGGWWGGTTDLAVAVDGDNPSNNLNYAQSKGGNFTADVTVGLSHGFALRYGYIDLSNSYNTATGPTQYNINAQEIDLLFKVGNSLGGLVNEAINIVTGKPLQWTGDPEGRNIYSLFVGAGKVFGDIPNQPDGKTCSTTGYTFGIINSTQLTDDLWSFGRLGLTANASILGEAGLAYQIFPGASVSITYKNYNLAATTTNSNNDTSFIYRSGFQYGLNYQF